MRVLSIDLDYIMEPSIEIYNDVVYDHNPETRWRNLFEQTPFRDNSFEINISNLMYCYNTFLKAIKECESVSFGFSHDAILFELDNYEEPIDLINIDHHDDVFNGDYIGDMGVNEGLSKEYFEMESGGRINEGNWIAYLKSKEKLNSYTWIRNENSKNVEWTQFNAELIGQDNYIHTVRDFYLIEEYEKFDHVFVCLSPQYIPHRFWHYFAMFISVYEELNGQPANVISKTFESEQRYLKTSDEILHECSVGRR